MPQNFPDWLPWAALTAALTLLAACLAAIRTDGKFIRRRLEREEQGRRLWSRALADASASGLLVHRAGVILMMNNALVRLLGVREREWLGQNFSTIARDDQIAALRAELEAPTPTPSEFTLLRASKQELVVELSSQTLEFEGQPATVTSLRDITQAKADALRIHRLAHYDALTGLPNRAMFEAAMKKAVAANDRAAGLTLFVTDIDQFRQVNAKIGRAGGDQLLQQLAQRLTALAAKDDMLARLGGDKFALLLSGGGHRGPSLGGQVLAACQEPFVIEGQLVQIRLSIGVALYPEHAADAPGLLQAGEFALAQAARDGGAMHLYRHEEAVQLTQPRPATQAAPANPRDELRTGLARGEIKLLYQPLVSLADLSVCGFEATARWQHSTRGLLTPEQFFPIAEEAGLLPELFGQLMERAAAEAVAAGAPRMSMNIGAAECRDPDFRGRLVHALQKAGLRPELFEIEVPEAMLGEFGQGAGSLLQSLREAGVGVVLDDFGAGASSLGALCQLPLSRLKLDKRVVQKLGRDRTAEAIVGAVLTLAGNLHLEVTALGVETDAQLEHLRRHGCHSAQGPLLGEPGSRAIARPGSRPALIA